MSKDRILKSLMEVEERIVRKDEKPLFRGDGKVYRYDATRLPVHLDVLSANLPRRSLICRHLLYANAIDKNMCMSYF